MMDTCPYCRNPIKMWEDSVQCPSCYLRHHTECWEENGGCTIYGCPESPDAKAFRQDGRQSDADVEVYSQQPLRLYWQDIARGIGFIWLIWFVVTRF